MEDCTFSCKVCFEDYDESDRRPKIMTQCGHTICLQCTRDIFNRMHPIPSCPLCRQPVKMDLHHLKDNYELLGALASKPTKFWCENCQSVAVKACIMEHSIKSLDKVISEKVLENEEKFASCVIEERALLNEVEQSLKKTLEAIQNSLVTRLEMELKLCQERMAHLEQLSLKFNQAQKEIALNGDVSVLNVFNNFQNKQHCTFLKEQKSIVDKSLKYRVTVASQNEKFMLTFGHADEDKVLAYLLSIPVQSSSNTFHSKQVKCPMVLTEWAQSPWLSVWSKFGDEASGKYGNTLGSDPANIPAELEAKPDCQSLQIYVDNIKKELTSKIQLTKVFSQFGEVRSVFIAQSKQRENFPYAFVTFTSKATVKRVLNQKHIIKHDYGLSVWEKKGARRRPKISPSAPPLPLSEFPSDGVKLSAEELCTSSTRPSTDTTGTGTVESTESCNTSSIPIAVSRASSKAVTPPIKCRVNSSINTSTGPSNRPNRYHARGKRKEDCSLM